ncbi:MAG TPA: FAD-dependent oxidoreductase [Luteimonas sp.]|nr:FAD-dependent oxidoreductase [Luteimonas sp.]
MGQSEAPTGPDFGKGVPLADVPQGGVLAGHVDGEAVLLARLDDGFHAVAGSCTHYGGPLGEGLVVGDQVHCPWHHACFSLRTGEALRAPAFKALARWRTEIVGDSVFVREQEKASHAPPPRPRVDPGAVVIVGGGAAGFAAAQRLRALGFDGPLSMLSADADPPCDRPNLSKDYLAGTAQEDWIPLQGPKFFAKHDIDLRLGCEVAAIDVAARRVRLASGEELGYGALLLATGSEPRRLQVPGFDRPNVFALRTLADARAIVAVCAQARSVTFVGGGFIGMEAAGALRSRGLAVHVVESGEVPMERALGRELGAFVAGLHRDAGVVFHLRAGAKGFDGHELALQDGTAIAADVVVVGVGVTPRTQLAAAAGLAVDDGIVVDARLQAAAPGVYAAGDVARYRHRGELVRVEHWVHAERQGQAVAANMLGAGQPFADVPFFWTHHQGVELRCSGHMAGWDRIDIDGALAARDFTARFFRAGRLVAAASVGRDRENLEIEETLRG